MSRTARFRIRRDDKHGISVSAGYRSEDEAKTLSPDRSLDFAVVRGGTRRKRFVVGGYSADFLFLREFASCISYNRKGDIVRHPIALLDDFVHQNLFMEVYDEP
jgi:hypothetical protein